MKSAFILLVLAAAVGNAILVGRKWEAPGFWMLILAAHLVPIAVTAYLSRSLAQKPRWVLLMVSQAIHVLWLAEVSLVFEEPEDRWMAIDGYYGFQLLFGLAVSGAAWIVLWIVLLVIWLARWRKSKRVATAG